MSGTGFNSERQAVFERAAARWTNIITTDIEDINFQDFGQDLTANLACGFSDPTIIQTVDDLIIFASISPIDGAGGILGRAGPAFIRSNALPYVGCMQFDSADVAALEAAGAFEAVILHEMGHVLGIGTLWETKNLVSFSGNASCRNSSSFSSPPVFTGSAAVTEYAALGKTGDVPVEDNFGAGTQCGHWDEGVFDNELMTGFIEATSSLPLSRLTAASLQDLGYSVDFSTVDAYSLPSCSPNCTALMAPNAFDTWEVTLKPKAMINEEGDLVWLD